MPALKLSEAIACRSCRRFSSRVGCLLLRFWQPDRQTDRPAGHRWLVHIDQQQHAPQHDLAAQASHYRSGHRPDCPAHIEVNQ